MTDGQPTAAGAVRGPGHRLGRAPAAGRLLPTPIGNTLRAAETARRTSTGWTPSRLAAHVAAHPRHRSPGTHCGARRAGWVGGHHPIGPAVPRLRRVVPVGRGRRPRRGRPGTGGLVPSRAAAFAALVETTFDLYRQDLYGQLRWPLPMTPHDRARPGTEGNHVPGAGVGRRHSRVRPAAVQGLAAAGQGVAHKDRRPAWMSCSRRSSR